MCAQHQTHQTVLWSPNAPSPALHIVALAADEKTVEEGDNNIDSRVLTPDVAVVLHVLVTLSENRRSKMHSVQIRWVQHVIKHFA